MSEPVTEAGRAAGYPYGEFDARKWAADFKRRFPESDEGLMLAWFANAIMTGYDRAANEREAAALAGPGADRLLLQEAGRALLDIATEAAYPTDTEPVRVLRNIARMAQRPARKVAAALSRSETT